VLGTNQLPQGAFESTATTVDIWDRDTQRPCEQCPLLAGHGAGGWKQHNKWPRRTNIQLDPTKGFVVTSVAGQDAGAVCARICADECGGAERQSNGYTVASSTYPQPVTLIGSGLTNGITGGTT